MPHALGLLRARRERPSRHRPAEQRDESAPLHAGHGDYARLQKTAATAERPRVSIDGAFTEKEENDPTACTVWGCFERDEREIPKIILMSAWRKWLPFH
ncbi:MAG TPA: hypothetical protein VKB89_30725, partial [Xanthobacteraceae bacterium]|nr:hypothetical protein [Xanthobacteraceae bacterium]